MNIAVSILLSVCLHGAGRTPSGPVIGKIVWQAWDEKTHRAIGAGTRIVRLEDVTVGGLDPRIAPKGKDFWADKRVYLGAHFGPALPHLIDLDIAADGFALEAYRDDRPTTHSWEHFDSGGAGHAVQLEGAGKLGFDTAKTRSGVQIRRMAFQTDVSIVVMEPGGPHGSWPPWVPRWKLRIAKGSTINWPVFTDGRLTAHGR